MKPDRCNMKKILGAAMAACLAFAGQSLQALQADQAMVATDGIVEVDVVEQNNYFRPGQAEILPPPAADCAVADHHGRLIVDKNTGDLWACRSDGWEVMEIIQ